MFRFWHRLKAAWLYCRVVPYFEQADAENFWTEDDALNLERFFSGQTGRKLKVRLTNFVTQSACNAVNSTGDYARQTGIAAGIAIGVGAIEKHFPRGMANNAESEQPEDMTALDVLAKEAAV